MTTVTVNEENVTVALSDGNTLSSAAASMAESLAGASGATLPGPLSFSGTAHRGIRLINLTTAQRDAIATPGAGALIWNTTTGTVQEYNGSAWTNVGGGGDTVWGDITGDIADQEDLALYLDGKQNIDADLTAIAALAPSNDDIIQRKAGAWTARTVAQYVTDILAGWAAHITTFLQSADAAAARSAIGAGTGDGDLLAANNLSELTATASTARTNLGLGTLATQSGTFSGGGTLATGGFTLTVPATGTAALLAVANVFTAAQTTRIEDAVTNTVANLTILNHRSSGTPATSFGVGISFLLQSSTTEDQDAAAVEAYWVSATHASRRGALRLSAYNIGTKKSLEIYSDSTTDYAKLVWGANADIGHWRSSNDLVYSTFGNHSFVNWDGSAYAEGLRVGGHGIIDYRGTMGNSSKTVGTDAPADWVEIKIGGTQYFIPAYAA